MRRDRDDARDLASLLEVICNGRPSDAAVGLFVSEARRMQRILSQVAEGRESPRGGRRKGLTSRSKLRRKPDTPYLAFVRSHPCCSCGATRDIEAHHTGRRGMGQKAPDSTAVPLCQGCHRYFHDHGHLPVDGYTGVVERTIAALQAEWQESA